MDIVADQCQPQTQKPIVGNALSDNIYRTKNYGVHVFLIDERKNWKKILDYPIYNVIVQN